ncbi:MAG TPA: TonB-dependent receptor [Vicinamibacterales bacterium]|nr:TonB-dependent receptor [Vicinamibacterales bacterium]
MRVWFGRRSGVVFVVFFLLGLACRPAIAQGLGGAGTIQGIVHDPTGSPMQAVDVMLANPVAGFMRTATTDATGHYVFSNLPPNPYHLSVSAQGFRTFEQDVEVRTGVPITVNPMLQVQVANQTVQVVGHVEDLVERDPTAHTDIDQSKIEKLPIESTGGLNQVVTMASPGVVADSNGFFHPVGDHAQTQFSIDNQPVTDQQSKLYSNQISPDAVESLEVITGVPPAEYGDKSSLVVHIVTKSGLDQAKPSGSATLQYGSFNTPTADFTLGGGSHNVGDFVAVSGSRTDRFLDPPELAALHDTGHNVSFFNRLDARPTTAGTFHLNVQFGQSGFDVPNTYETSAEDQHQDINSYNIAPGYSRVIGSTTLLTANAYVRRDHLTYSPSANPLVDVPASVGQDRTLQDMGGKADLTIVTGPHSLKFGATVSATRLHEQFSFGITDPTSGDFADDDGNFNPAFAPYDLTNGGSLLHYDQAATIKQQAAYVQDDIALGPATIKAGVRLDHYDGLTSKTLAQPRLGISYAAGAGTVLRASYGRTLETPYNENLLLSAGVGLNGLFGGGDPVLPGDRNEVEVGIQQGVAGWLVADFGYFNKHTNNAYDFGVLFDTPIAFPIAWDHSRLNGFTGRVDLLEHGGFSAFVVMAHTNAIFSPPGTGGILLEAADADFRIDHDQKFNSTTNLQYTFAKRAGAWAALSWRYDSGLVAGAVGSLEDALGLSADQQAAIGMSCGGTAASLDHPLTADECTPANFATALLRVPAEGTEDDVTNPPRVAPRNLFDLAIGSDRLLHTAGGNLKVRFSVLNLANKTALYNFLSTFSGTHFVAPRSYQVQLGWTF